MHSTMFERPFCSIVKCGNSPQNAEIACLSEPADSVGCGAGNQANFVSVAVQSDERIVSVTVQEKLFCCHNPLNPLRNSRSRISPKY